MSDSTMPGPDELKALVSLIDEPDPFIYADIESRLIGAGMQVIPLLEESWENCFDELIQTRLENIIHLIQFDNTLREMGQWKNLGESNLLLGLMIVARYQFPRLDEDHVRKQIDNIKQDVWLELNMQLTALEKVRVMNHVFFEIHGFRGNKTDFHNPSNSYINQVLESHKGNPILLSCVYMIVAQKLNLPIYGVNLPEHFVLAFVNDEDENSISFLPKDKVLFYINPFSGGAVFTANEIEQFLIEIKVDPKPAHFQPCTNTDIVVRVLNNLQVAYNKSKQLDKADEIATLRKVLE